MSKDNNRIEHLKKDAQQTNKAVKWQKFTPILNKLFMNKLRGKIEQQFALKNLDKTKKELQQRYRVPQDCKIYNYKQSETRRISKRYGSLIPEEAKQEINKTNRSMILGLSGILLTGSAYYGGAYYIKKYSKWGRLTASGIFQKALVYCILLNTTNYFMLVRNSDEIDLIFKHHIHYEKAICKYEEEVLAS